jgi:hypothetical protein
MIGMQEMLMQTHAGLDERGKIRLLPAWPTEWNVDFKLHVPYQTTVEGRLENGELVDLKVTPESRRKDVILLKLE